MDSHSAVGLLDGIRIFLDLFVQVKPLHDIGVFAIQIFLDLGGISPNGYDDRAVVKRGPCGQVSVEVADKSTDIFQLSP